jgi:hypothetical protein
MINHSLDFTPCNDLKSLEDSGKRNLAIVEQIINAILVKHYKNHPLGQLDQGDYCILRGGTKNLPTL